MRSVVLYTLMSLDGVAENPDTFVLEFDEEMHANLAEVIGAQDAVLLGRRQYQEWAPYWPKSDMQPFADFINSVPKYVFTSSPLTVEWTGTSTVDSLDVVRELKAQPGGDIGVHGSIGLSRALLAAGLVDRISLVVYPAVAGNGRKLFADGRPLTRLHLLSARSTSSGGLLLDYSVPR
ncbi:dihydrofolate reductase family protein [Paractinoplanes brasiliensis]|uniref:Dihydrofolate reductase n=1 Tax=Paractinoplanes brasiliensis TaxID=52695 RepID=A0A4R6J980_9ACTN|nr:dihydrofolate reductase family protein [Actinoplanes brasiliensis]TDO31747.1 dihydrofolate reductase [Actinoplanes brasiliensis]GID30660.1 deaminase reductase [Actinoplanes brasiliensis]